MRVVWTDSAAVDLVDAYEFIALDDPEVAASVVLHLRRTVVGTLTVFPESGRLGRVPGSRELVLKPFVVAYRLQDETIQVLRVLHGRRRWPERLE